MTLDDVDDLAFRGLVKTPLADAVLICDRRGWPMPLLNATAPVGTWRRAWTLGATWPVQRLALLVEKGEDLEQFFTVLNAAGVNGWRVVVVPLEVPAEDLEGLLELALKTP